MILLDVDGPLTDLVGTMCEQFGRDPSLAWWPRGEYELTKVFEMPEDDLWALSDHDWWVSLPLTPWAQELIDLCANQPGGFHLATSPLSHNPQSASGKLAWIQKIFGKSFRDYSIGPRKDLLAYVPRARLVDDFGPTCQGFAKAGGRATLFPRLWNDAHADHHDPMTVVRRDFLSDA